MEAALDWGTECTRGKRRVIRIDRRAIRFAAHCGLDLSVHAGVHVVVAPDAVITTYRNRQPRRVRS
jgi:hypothetical protein